MSNHLIHETSHYLLQHAENPVEWYPWGKEAFDRADREDKPVFLSIGYSTCHWCHVMAHESFEDPEIAAILNRHFISVKVDKEQRPDIDSIYMAVCQALTGSGGWPTSIFMTAGQKPFYAGTYFPKTSQYGRVGFKELLLAVRDKWENDREALLHSADAITEAFKSGPVPSGQSAQTKPGLLSAALAGYQQSFDKEFGGFGDTPKFPAAHNLLFLMQQYQKNGDAKALQMAEETLRHMYAGGLFDHIGGGFSRYSTDRYFLVPHFEKMLYDNALLILAYCKAHEVTGSRFYQEVALKTAHYVLTEMTSPDGGFYSAQDADSDGVEGKYYVFEPGEIIALLGEKDGTAFNRHYDITKDGNFEGKSIPNLLHGSLQTGVFDAFLPAIREYRRSRCFLHTDDKILTAWNALMISAFCALYRSSRNRDFLEAAIRAQRFIEAELCDRDTLYVSIRKGIRSHKGFLDDYAFYCYALLCLYDVTLDRAFLERADAVADKAITDFFDEEHGGFYLYGRENETLIFRPRESYDGAMPSGNSMMAYSLVRLNLRKPREKTEKILQKQLDYMCGEAEKYPAGYAMFLSALSDYLEPPPMITVVLGDKEDLKDLVFKVPADSAVRVLEEETDGYKLAGGRTTYYVCKDHVCQAGTNHIFS